MQTINLILRDRENGKTKQKNEKRTSGFCGPSNGRGKNNIFQFNLFLSFLHGLRKVSQTGYR